jgi:hypothetical protein
MVGLQDVGMTAVPEEVSGQEGPLSKVEMMVAAVHRAFGGHPQGLRVCRPSCRDWPRCIMNA